MKKLDLGPFWAIIGSSHTDHLVNFVRQFLVVEHLSFAYCHNLDADTLFKIIAALPSSKHRLRRLNLYYCYKLNNTVISRLVRELPQIEYIDIGRCIHIDGDGVQELGILPNLKYLRLRYLQLDANFFYSLDNSFQSLEFLDIKFAKVDPELLEHAQAHLKYKIVASSFYE